MVMNSVWHLDETTRCERERGRENERNRAREEEKEEERVSLIVHTIKTYGRNKPILQNLLHQMHFTRCNFTINQAH